MRKLKKLQTRLGFALVAIMASVPAWAVNESGICPLIKELSNVFKVLRTLAFVGAAFIIAGWAWEFITKPADAKVDKFKEKGVGMLVGFIMLFAIGVVLTFLMSTAGGGALGCKTEFANWGK